MLKNLLPEIYSKILGEDFLQLNPVEKLATCNDCYKLKKAAPKPHFNEKTKCCTYYPFLPNYLLGGVLLDERMEFAQKKIHQMLAEKTYATPLGISAPPAYQKVFQMKKSEDYGQREDLLCPFYIHEGGLCGVWAYRGHECTSYYCHSSYGANGEEFWAGIRDVLFELEMFLSQMTMAEFGFSNSVINSCLKYIRTEEYAEGAGWSLPSTENSRLWMNYYFSPKEFYIESFQFVTTHANRLKEEWHERWQKRQQSEYRKDYAKFLGSLIVGGSLQ